MELTGLHKSFLQWQFYFGKYVHGKKTVENKKKSNDVPKNILYKDIK